MAAFDAFRRFEASLSAEDRKEIEEVRSTALSDLLDARSEEARLRIVYEYVQEVRGRLVKRRLQL